MKRIILLLLLLWSLGSGAQLFNNEWIDYNKTYYKIKVAFPGAYHITGARLSAIGLGAVNADQFQLWRNGQLVPIFTTVQNAPLGPTDYIEFYGEKNDGKPDNPLYREADWQLSDKLSLQTDTACYFLTVNPGGNNRHLVATPNNLLGNTLTPEPYFMHTTGIYWAEKVHSGRAEIVGDSYTYSASYDMGECLSTLDMANNASKTFNATGLFPYTVPMPGVPAPILKINAAGNAVNPRYFKVAVNGDSIAAVNVNYYDYVRAKIPLTISQIQSGSANVEITNRCLTGAVDRLVLNQAEITYARTFNFGSASSFTFELPANPAGNYLEIANFTYPLAGEPVLIDLTNNTRYVVEHSNPALLKVVLQPSAVDRKLVMMSTTNFFDVSFLEQRNFINYALAGNQGDYLIITNSLLTNATPGGDPVEEYRQYRSSPAGGSYNAKVYLIDQLIDQFAYGIKMHPLSVRNFLRWARRTYSVPLKNVLLIGKGVLYTLYRFNEVNPDMSKLCLVPTFGYPASDILLSAEGNSSIPLTPIGRLSVINKDEIRAYLNKLKQYEQVQQEAPTPYIADMAWKKNIVHVTGASDDITTSILQAANEGFRRIIEDTIYGGKVYSFTKSTSEAVQQLSSNQLAGLFNQGLGMLEYFGHSSASTLEFNLDNPQNYNNPGKYPIFMVMGCNAGGFYGFNAARFFTKETISERYVLAPERGSVAFMASTHLGIVHYLDIYATRFYQSMAYRMYGATLGAMMEDAIRRTFDNTTENDFYARFQCEEFTLHGDPAIKPYGSQKPDFAIEDQLVKVSPSFISMAEKTFEVKVGFMNLGIVPSGKNIVVELKRQFPDNTFQVIRDTIPATRYADSLVYKLDIFGAKDKGLNKITIKIDADNEVDETFETNNSITKDVYIFEDELRPIYPYNFSIIHEQNPVLYASTANAFAENRQYLMEMDTTENFNSPLKVSGSVTTPGGIVEFTSPMTFTDSTVYYWRVAPYASNGDTKWNVASFQYIAGSEDGFGQSHIFQNLKSSFDHIQLDSASRQYTLGNSPHSIFVRSGVFPTGFSQADGFSVALDDDASIASVCGSNNIVFNVIDPISFKAWYNGPQSTDPGQYGSEPVCGPNRSWNFQFNIGDTARRRRIVQFMDLVPDGYFVVVRNCWHATTPADVYVDQWKADASYLGAGNTIYDRMLGQGFAEVDSFNRNRAFVFIYRKNRPDLFQPIWTFSDGIYDAITLTAHLETPDTVGYITSPAYGPARGWKQLHWRGSSIDATPSDIPLVSVIGVDNNGVETPLINSIDLANQDYDISNIDAKQYPYIKLKMRNQDAVYRTPWQLRYWMVTYNPAPEGAVAPNLYFTTRDTVEVGEPFNFGIAFKNISKVDFDSVKVKVTVTDKDNFENKIYEGYQKPLAVMDTIKLNVPINTEGLSGHNSIFVNFNPDYDQAEQHLFNNYAFRELYVRPDSLHPFMDVTFDGIHILNRDIVSAKPEIVIKLKDEAKWMLLDDPSLVTVEVKYPGGTSRKFTYTSGNDTLQFIPASQSSNNTASINFNPFFLNDGDYELIVSGRDKSGNDAGTVGYRVNFRVINKPMISNMLNYPNPFTTSTAFVFTLTGSQVPQNLRIQILTITGKIVREITKDELGPIRIGRNITEFKWDGTDQYGQKLANGIYLYRVITNLNGKSLDKYTSKEVANPDNTDKFFNNGYGKMYLMR